MNTLAHWVMISIVSMFVYFALVPNYSKAEIGDYVVDCSYLNKFKKTCNVLEIRYIGNYDVVLRAESLSSYRSMTLMKSAYYAIGEGETVTYSRWSGRLIFYSVVKKENLEQYLKNY